MRKIVSTAKIVCNIFKVHGYSRQNTSVHCRYRSMNGLTVVHSGVQKNISHIALGNYHFSSTVYLGSLRRRFSQILCTASLACNRTVFAKYKKIVFTCESISLLLDIKPRWY